MAQAEILQDVPPAPKDLFIGLLAALSMRGADSIKISDYALHESFAKALEIFRAEGGQLAALANRYYDDGVSEANDELERAIIVAEGSGYLRFPNPTYRKMQLTIAPKAAEEILRRRPEFRHAFVRAAEEIDAELSV